MGYHTKVIWALADIASRFEGGKLVSSRTLDHMIGWQLVELTVEWAEGVWVVQTLFDPDGNPAIEPILDGIATLYAQGSSDQEFFSIWLSWSAGFYDKSQTIFRHDLNNQEAQRWLPDSHLLSPVDDYPDVPF